MGSGNSTVGTVFTTTAGAVVNPSGWNAPLSGYGVEAGQNVLCVLVDGDTTPTAVATSNVYSIDVIWHWEAVPADVTAVAYEVSPSPANTTLVDKTLNLVTKMPVARVGSNGPTRGGF